MSSSDSPRASSPDETPLSNDESLQNLEAGLGALALEKCRSDEDTELLDAIDNLRSQGLREHISLPQLIVCGNQSSGKSSVLEAISGVPFPSSDNTVSSFFESLTPNRVTFRIQRLLLKKMEDMMYFSKAIRRCVFIIFNTKLLEIRLDKC